MIDLRYNKLIRKILIKLSYILPNRIEKMIDDWLYPDDAIITFR